MHLFIITFLLFSSFVKSYSGNYIVLLQILCHFEKPNNKDNMRKLLFLANIVFVSRFVNCEKGKYKCEQLLYNINITKYFV